MLQIKFEIGPSKITRDFNYDWKGMGVHNKAAKWSFAPLLEIGTKNQNFVANLKSGAQFRLNWFNSCIDSVFVGMTLTMHKNQVYCPGVVQWWVCSSLISAALAVCRGKLRNLHTDCSTVWLYCITITWQQIFMCSLQVTVGGIFPHVSVERK